MHSPRSRDKEISQFGSFNAYERKPSTQSIFSRKIATEIVDQRVKSYSQLESFYMPYLKKIFEDNRVNNPSLRSPQQLLFTSRLLEMRDSQSKRRIQFLQGQNEKKDKKINQMSDKMVSLLEKIRMFEPNINLDYDIPTNSLEQSERNIKKLESLYNVRNEETIFRLKLKAMNLFEQFDMPKQDIDVVNGLSSQTLILQTLINKLKNKIKEIKQKSKTIIDESSSHKMGSEKLTQEIRRLTQTCQLLKNNEKRLKQRLDDIKIQWTTSNEKLIERQKEVQILDVETFRLKRLLEEKQSLILKSNSVTFTKSVVADDLKRDYENQIRDQRALIASINIENSQLKHQLQFVNGQLQQYQIKEKFKTQQHEKTYREYIRWKERCEWFQKQKEGKVNFYEEKNKNLQTQLQKLKNQIAEVQSVDILSQSRNMDWKNNYQSISLQLQFKCQQVKILQDKCRRLEEQGRIRTQQTISSQRYILQDCNRKNNEEIQKRIKQKDYEMRQMMNGIKYDYEQRIQIKDEKYQKQILQLQNQLRKYQGQNTLIKKKSDFVISKNIGGIDTYSKVNY